MKVLAVLLLLLNVAYVAWVQFGTDAGQSVVASPVAAQQAPFIEAKEMLLLVSERPVPSVQPEPVVEQSVVDIPVSPPAEPVADISAPLPAEPWCALVAGFADESAATGFLSAVNGLGGIGDLQSEQVPISSTWWVHLPPFPTQEAAAPMLAELRAKQIDNYYIRAGELAGAISLGVFRSSQRARVAQQELNAKGYSPSIYEMFRVGTRFNASIRLEDRQLREQAAWVDLERGLENVSLQEIACK